MIIPAGLLSSLGLPIIRVAAVAAVAADAVAGRQRVPALSHAAAAAVAAAVAAQAGPEQPVERAAAAAVQPSLLLEAPLPTHALLPLLRLQTRCRML